MDNVVEPKSTSSGSDSKSHRGNFSCSPDSMNNTMVSLRNVQNLSADGKTPYERRFGEPFSGQSHFSGQKSKVICQRKIKRSSNSSARKSSRAFSWATLFMREEAGKETYSLQPLRNCKRTTLPKLRSKAQNRRSFRAERGQTIIFPRANGSVKLARKDSEVRPSDRVRQDSEEGEHRSDLQGETDEPDSGKHQEQDDLEATHDFCSISGSFIYRHHVQERQKLDVPQESFFLFSPKCIDVVR